MYNTFSNFGSQGSVNSYNQNGYVMNGNSNIGMNSNNDNNNNNNNNNGAPWGSQMYMNGQGVLLFSMANNNNNNNNNNAGMNNPLQMGTNHFRNENGFSSNGFPFMGVQQGGAPMMSFNNTMNPQLSMMDLPQAPWQTPYNGQVNFNSYNNLGEFEVHDNQLKAPISVVAEVVIPTAGSNRLFSNGPKPIVYGSKNMFRICDNFQEGTCSNFNCPDVHVNPDFLGATRRTLTTWLLDKEAEFNKDFTENPEKVFKIFVSDVKEIVEVPIRHLVFTKGLYVDPSTRFKRTRGTNMSQNAAIAAQVPTGCGLFSMDPPQCKWGRWCNQVHISTAWIKNRKKEFENWFDQIEGEYIDIPENHIFTVHDPQLKLSLQIPKWAIVSFSRGLFQGSGRKAPSVCLLFQKNRCTAGSCCNQIHVSPAFLNVLRNNAHLLEQGSLPAAVDPAITQELDLIKESLREQQREEVKRLMEERETRQNARRREAEEAQQQQTDGTSGADTKAEGAGAPLFEHIPFDETMEGEGGDSSPLVLIANVSTASMGGGDSTTKVRPNGSYTNNPYGGGGSMSDLQTLHFNTGIAIGGIENIKYGNSSSSFKRTPAASITTPYRGNNTSGMQTSDANSSFTIHNRSIHVLTKTSSNNNSNNNHSNSNNGKHSFFADSTTEFSGSTAIQKMNGMKFDQSTSDANLHFDFDVSTDSFPSHNSATNMVNALQVNPSR